MNDLSQNQALPLYPQQLRRSTTFLRIQPYEAVPWPLDRRTWHRVGLVWDRTDRILYVDDVEVGRDKQDNLARAVTRLYLGAGSGLAPGSFWSGLIDDVRIYNRAVKP